MTEDDSADNIKKRISWYFKTGTSTSCPAEETLADYLQEKLDRQTRDEVERHLAMCDRCAQTLLATANVLDEADAPIEPVPEHVLASLFARIPSSGPSVFRRIWQSLREQARIFSERLDSLIVFQQPDVVLVRGGKKLISKNLVVLEKVFKTIRLEIEIEKTGAGCADIKVVATRPDSNERFPGVRIDIRAGSRELASFVAVRGEALFEKIAFGDYRLIARYDNRKLGEVRLAIKE